MPPMRCAVAFCAYLDESDYNWQRMRTKYEQCIQRILQDEAIASSEKVRFDVNVGGASNKGRVFWTETRLLFYVRTPMGMQATIVWLKEVESLSYGKKKGLRYVQLLGQRSRILVLFKSKEARDRFKQWCIRRISSAPA